MVISLTTTPCMCAHLLQSAQEGKKHNWSLPAPASQAFNGLVWIYRKSLLVGAR